MEKIRISICLSDIPKEAIYESDRNGKKYLTCDLSALKNGADQYGNTHSLAVSMRQEDGTWQNTYIGKGKTVEFGGGQQSAPQAAAPEQSAPKDDLPF